MIANPVPSPRVDISPILERQIDGRPDPDRSSRELGGGGITSRVSMESDEPARGGQHPREHSRVSPGGCASQGDDARLWKLLGKQKAVEFPLADDQRPARSNHSRVGIDQGTIAVGFRVLRLAIVDAPDLDPLQAGVENQDAISLLGRLSSGLL